MCALMVSYPEKMVLVNPRTMKFCGEELDRKLSGAEQCVTELKRMARYIANGALTKNTINDFLSKVRYLERDVHDFNDRLREQIKRNTQLTKELQDERAKSQARGEKMKQLDDQVTTIEAKLQVRLAQLPPKARCCDAAVGDCSSSLTACASSDVELTMNNLRLTTMSSFNTIRTMIKDDIHSIGDGGGGAGRVSKTSGVLPKVKSDMSKTMSELKMENESLLATIKERERSLIQMQQHADEMAMLRKEVSDRRVVVAPHVESCVQLEACNSGCSSISQWVTDDLSEEPYDPRWDEKDYPMNILRSMQQRVNDLIQNGIKQSEDLSQLEEENSYQLHCEEMQIELRERNDMVQTKIDQYFDRMP